MTTKRSKLNSTNTGTKMIQTSRPVRWAGKQTDTSRHVTSRDRRHIPDVPGSHWSKRSLTHDPMQTTNKLSVTITPIKKSPVSGHRSASKSVR